MRLGYPCINLSLPCRSSKTFRLASYSAVRFRSTVAANLQCLSEILSLNASSDLLFFRITSDIIPFASHPVNTVPWQEEFKKEFQHIGSFIKKNRMRVSMHPDQFVVLNAKDEEIVKRSVAELVYHADVLDLLGTCRDAKIQIHLGGVYGDKAASISRFIERAQALPRRVLKRLVIENDERLYSLRDCLAVHKKTGLPVVLDVFHHSCNHNGESMREAILLAHKTWRRHDGPPIMDYSTQQKGRRLGTHTQTIDLRHFRTLLNHLLDLDADIMLEIKDKEKSALKALRLLNTHGKKGRTSRGHA
jgi:UV DNA damage endonuclease